MNRRLGSIGLMNIAAWSALALAFAMVMGCGIGEQESSAQGLLISGVSIVSPERESIETGSVVIEGDRIRTVSTTGEPDRSTRRYTTIDGEGLYLIPGLIDSHVHLAGVPGFRYPTPPEVHDLAEAYREQLPRSYLYFGYTTLIDLNVVDRDFIRRVRQSPLHPDIFDCGGALALANGYPMVLLPPEQRFDSHPNFLYDPRQADEIPAGYSAEDHSPAAVVQRVADADGICTKTHWEDGFGSAKIWPTPTAEMIADVIERSHAHGLTATMHANAYEAQRFAADVGVDVIVHGLWNWDGLRADDGLPEPIEKVLDTIVAKEIGFQPTVQVLEGLQALFRPEFFDDPHLAAVLPSGLLQWYRTDDARWFAEELRNDDFDGLPDERIRGIQESVLRQGEQVLHYLAERDARLLFGTDTPSSPTYGNPPGLNGLLEMRSWVGAGVSLRKLFAAATTDNARAFHLDSDYGTVEAGKVANLVLLQQNPLESVEAYDSIVTVILRGRPIDRQDLVAR